MRIPLAPEGYPFILLSLALAVGLWFANIRVGFYPIFYLALSLFLFIVWFFRDPERAIPNGASDVVSPADGKVIKAELITDDRFLHGEALKISIFMNVFNVHVNRVPFNGVLKKVIYNPGKFFNASFDKASLLNEQNTLLIERADGSEYAVNQIAGLIARRIVCRVKEGAALERGKRFGMIRFGSRLDIFLQPQARVKVRIGEKVSAGSTVLASWPLDEQAGKND